MTREARIFIVERHNGDGSRDEACFATLELAQDAARAFLTGARLKDGWLRISAVLHEERYEPGTERLSPEDAERVELRQMVERLLDLRAMYRTDEDAVDAQARALLERTSAKGR